MDKIWLIFQREYLTRVRKKSFVVMTFVGPLLLAALFAVPIWLATSDSDVVTVRVLDESGTLAGLTSADADIRFQPTTGPLPAAKQALHNQKGTVLLYAPPSMTLAIPVGLQVFSESSLGLDQQLDLERQLRKQIEQFRLQRAGIDARLLDSARVADLDVKTTTLSASGEEKDDSAGLVVGLGYAGAFLIYIFIFLYGVQVMRGVMEEKTNRIVEVIISSVRPFQLMMGKILGIAAVGLTQFFLWTTLSYGLTTAIAAQLGAPAPVVMQAPPRVAGATPDGLQKREAERPADNKVSQFIGLLGRQNWALLIGVFVFYFLGGYLIYAALFGAVGAAVDQETDSQQFMMPITMPLVLTFIVAQTVIINNPNGAVATWLSLVPFTSPIAMVMRVPFGGVAGWQLALSMALLVLGFIGTTWLAGRIYRVGILLYGKKPTFRELGKWLFYKG